ncbi:MAG: flagellar basal-body rod protein FlgF [Candidatus Sericytochromatia bacterium]|nr:flagellar basal-body rod protein FlgF [Candidatus Sericytochromatia bacterium]
MIRGLYTASAGMQVEQIRQDVIANNLANMNTTGFKRDLAVLEAREKMRIKRTQDPVSGDPLAPTRRTPIGELGAGVLVNTISKRFEAGNMRETSEPLDMAIEGDGFFTLQEADGDKLYTRAGDFARNGAGQLIDKSGRLVLGQNGPISLRDGVSFTVMRDGAVMVNGTAVDRLALARFDNPDADLEKVGDTAFRFRGAGEPPASTAEVHQGVLEGSNVNSLREMVEMIAALRHYEANQRALQAEDETLGKAVNEVARA